MWSYRNASSSREFRIGHRFRPLSYQFDHDSFTPLGESPVKKLVASEIRGDHAPDWNPEPIRESCTEKKMHTL